MKIIEAFQKHRTDALCQRQWPGALFLLSSALRAGLPLAQSA